MPVKRIISRSFKLQLDRSINTCTVHSEGSTGGTFYWEIIALNGQIMASKEVILQDEQSFDISLINILPGHYILSITEEGQGTRHLKLVV